MGWCFIAHPIWTPLFKFLLWAKFFLAFWFLNVSYHTQPTSPPSCCYRTTSFIFPLYFFFVGFFPPFRLLKNLVRAWRAFAVISPMAAMAPVSVRTAATVPRWVRLKTPLPFSSWISLYKICKSKIWNLCPNFLQLVSLWLTIHMVKGKRKFGFWLFYLFFCRFQDHVPPEELPLSHQMAALNCHDCFRVVLEQWLIVARSKVRRVLIPIHSLLKRARHFPLLNGFRRYIILWGGGGVFSKPRANLICMK